MLHNKVMHAYLRSNESLLQVMANGHFRSMRQLPLHNFPQHQSWPTTFFFFPVLQLPIFQTQSCDWIAAAHVIHRINIIDQFETKDFLFRVAHSLK